MTELCVNRLTILGAKPTVTGFRNSGWEMGMRARFVEPHELMATRFTWTFDTTAPPVQRLQMISRAWPTLTFLLDYEWETKRKKGIAKAIRGELEIHEISY